MKDGEELKELVQLIIRLHESRKFEELASYISSIERTKESWFSEKRFHEVCEAIEKEIGSVTSLEYIDALKRKTSSLTLWKATYSKTSDEVLWKIIFDIESNKIILMHINWEHL